MTIIFGTTPPPPSRCLTCKSPRWQWYRETGRWICMRCFPGNPCLIEFGEGPMYKQCRDCAHMVANRQSAVYWKCDLRKNTHGAGPDHRVKWPACARFAPIEPEEMA